MTTPVDVSISPHMEEPAKLSLRKWKQLSIRITVIHRFSKKYSAKSFIAPGLTAVSPQKSNTSEGSETRNLSTGALFSPNTPIQDAPKQKFQSEKKNGEGYSFKLDDIFTDHRVLSPIQILVTGLTSQINEADLLGRRIIVTVIDLASIQEGTTATDNYVVWAALKGLIFLLCLSGVKAQDESGDGKRECPMDLPYNVQAAAWTLIFMIAVIAGRINRRPFVRAPVAAPLAVPPPAAAPPALPAADAAPLAVPAPAAAPPALPAAAAVPAVVRPPAAAPPALPAAAAAPLAVPPPAAAPPALPAAAAAPPAVAIPMGFVDIMDGLMEDPTPARLSNPDLHIHCPVPED